MNELAIISIAFALCVIYIIKIDNKRPPPGSAV